MSGKNALRARMRVLRSGWTDDELSEAGAAIARRVSSVPRFRDARAVAVFLSASGEPDTAPVIAIARRL